MPTTFTKPAESATTFTKPAASDFVSGYAAKFGIAKFSKARFGKDTEFTSWTNPNQSEATTFSKPNES